MLCNMHSSRSLLEMSTVFLHQMPEQWFHYLPERHTVSQTCSYIPSGASNILLFTQTNFHIIVELCIKDDLCSIICCLNCLHIQIKNQTLKQCQLLWIKFATLSWLGHGYFIPHLSNSILHYVIPLSDSMQPETLIMLTFKWPVLTCATAWI